ncbi:MAG: hypothetical protein RXO32_04780 [Thermoproteus sp.]
MDRKKLGLLGFAAIALAAISLASLEFTNVTNWYVNATLPPAMKYAGADTSITARNDGSTNYNSYIYVTYSYDKTGLNVTRISIVGFTGDVTNYTNALKVCNYYYNGPLTVSIKYIGYTSSSQYPQYVRQFVVYNSYNAQQWVGFITTGTTTTTQSGPVTLGQLQPGGCIPLGVYVLVDPSAYSAGVANGKTVLATYEVDITFSTT